MGGRRRRRRRHEREQAVVVTNLWRNASPHQHHSALSQCELSCKKMLCGYRHASVVTQSLSRRICIVRTHCLEAGAVAMSVQNAAIQRETSERAALASALSFHVCLSAPKGTHAFITNGLNETAASSSSLQSGLDIHPMIFSWPQCYEFFCRIL